MEKGTARLVRNGQAILPIGLCALVIVFGIFSRSAAIEQFVNSDSLLPAHMAWDVMRHDYALANFHWPRVPSLPDLAFFFAMDLAGVNWRTSWLLYTCLVAAGVVLGMGWVIARMRGSDYSEGVTRAGIAVLAALLFAMVGLEHSPDEPRLWLPQLYLLVPVTHGNAFLLSLFTCCAALGAVRGDRRQAWAAWALCALGTFSDTLFLGYFLVPFSLAGTIMALRPGAPTFAALLRFVAGATLACGLGWLAKVPLTMQEMMLVRPDVWASLSHALNDLFEAPWILIVIALTLLLTIRTLRTLRGRPQRPAPAVVEADREWLMMTGLGASVMSLGLTYLLYDHFYAYRYAIPLFWWPVGLALGLARLPTSGKGRAALATLTVLATVCAVPFTATAMPRWRAPLERCLSEHRQEWGLKAGLATYWHSRLVMASSDWQHQVDQIDADGRAYMWGNNFASYGHDMLRPGHPPQYNFVVVDEKMDPFEIEILFGSPIGREACGRVGVWIYDQHIVPPGTEYRPPNSFKLKFVPE